MTQKTNAWLEHEKVQQIFWRTTYKMVAKNFYVDVNTQNHQVLDKQGWLEMEIKQRKDLFRVSSALAGADQK